MSNQNFDSLPCTLSFYIHLREENALFVQGKS